MSLNKNQVELINSVFGAFDIKVPDISKGVSSTLIKAFEQFSKTFSKTFEKGKGKGKGKVEKSPEEKQPPNVYMTFRKMNLETIKAGLSEGTNIAEALKEAYEKFKKTPEYKILQDKCKADFATWKTKDPKGDAKGNAKSNDVDDSSDSDEAPKKAAPKKKAEKSKKPVKKTKKVKSDDEE